VDLVDALYHKIITVLGVLAVGGVFPGKGEGRAENNGVSFNFCGGRARK
jgi:hypothetical protein